MNLRLLLIWLALSFLATSTALAQSPPETGEKEQKEQKARLELERKALALLDATIEEAQSLKLAENRALFEATAADALWTHDEKRARLLFREAMTGLFEAMSDASARGAQPDNSYWSLTSLRQQVLQMIARRDSALAMDLLHATRPPANSGLPGGLAPDQELALEQSLAAQAAASDPRRALQLAEESLAKGVSMELLNALHRLQQQDPESANRLAGEIVKKLQTEDFTKNPQAVYLAQYLLVRTLQPAQPAGKPLVLDDQAMRDLADLATRAVLDNQSHGGGNVMMLSSILPELEKRMPERAAQIRRKIEEASAALDPEQKKWVELQPLMQKGSADELLAAAAQAPAGMRNALYSNAAMKLLSAGDADRARQIVSDHLSGPERDRMLAQIDGQMMARDLKQGKIEEARKAALRMTSRMARAAALAGLAAKVAAGGDRKLALQILDEAQSMIPRPPDNKEQLDALIEVARAFATVEPARAFELIEPLVDQANELIAAVALLDRFGSSQGAFRRGEMVVQPGFANISALYGREAASVALLARADFERTRALADRFQRPEVRALARLLVVQALLSKHLGADVVYGGGGSSNTFMITETIRNP